MTDPSEFLTQRPLAQKKCWYYFWVLFSLIYGIICFIIFFLWYYRKILSWCVIMPCITTDQRPFTTKRQKNYSTLVWSLWVRWVINIIITDWRLITRQAKKVLNIHIKTMSKYCSIVQRLPWLKINYLSTMIVHKSLWTGTDKTDLSILNKRLHFLCSHFYLISVVTF